MIDMARKYMKLHTAIVKAIKDIEENDDQVTLVEIHGPHTRYDIKPTPSGSRWISTEIEK